MKAQNKEHLEGFRVGLVSQLKTGLILGMGIGGIFVLTDIKHAT